MLLGDDDAISVSFGFAGTVMVFLLEIQNVGVICFPLAIHNGPEAISGYTIEWDPKFLTDLTACTVRTNEVLRTNMF